MAEATLMVTGGRRLSGASYQVAERGALEQGLLAPAEAGAARTTLVSCGQPSLGQRVVIVDPETRYPMSDGRVGEIWVAGESVCSGYWNATPEVSDAFDARLAGTGEGPFFRTGDLGLIKDGDLFVTGRIKELIILHGKNHYPHDIERSVEQSNLSLRPGSGVAFSIDVDDEERLVVVHEVDRAHLRALNVDGVLADMRQAVSLHHGINAHAVVLIRPAALPKTSSGKPQRRAARTQFMAGTLDIVGTG
jgi:acyl-CoA synthetase (AMP-forming)/AMP-acid ligase II